MGSYFVKDYPVGLGRGGRTPESQFVVEDKIPKPDWYPEEGGVVPYGDPDNPLGTRWMGINSPSVGIHGTYTSSSIGTAASHGCIRMHLQQAEELFELVFVGTPVEIVP